MHRPLAKIFFISVFLSIVLRSEAEFLPHGVLSSLSQSGDHLILTLTPFPSGAVTTSTIGSLNTTFDCPSCMDHSPFSVPYGDKYFEALLTNNSLLLLQIEQDSETDSNVRINASVPFNTSCRPRHYVRSAFNEENYYVVFDFCETWNPRRRDGVISPPPNTISGPSTVASTVRGDDYIITARETEITISDVSNNINPIQITPASDQCVEYTNLYPLRCPTAAEDNWIDFFVECRTSDQTHKLFTVRHNLFFGTRQTELIGVRGTPLTSDFSDFIAILDGSELIVMNYNDLTQLPGRYTFPDRIETTYFYEVASTTWLSVVIANQDLFLVNVAEFVSTRGGPDSMFEIPNTNAGPCDPTSLPQRMVTSEHLMVAVQNNQRTFDFVALNLNTSGTPSEVGRVERITQRPSYIVHFQEGVLPPPSTDPPTTDPPTTEPEATTTAETVEPLTTQPVDEETTATVGPPDHSTDTAELPPDSPPKKPVPVHIIAPSTGGVLLALVIVIIVAIGVGCVVYASKHTKSVNVSATQESSRNRHSGSISPLSNTSQSSLSSDGVIVYKPPYQESTGQQ